MSRIFLVLVHYPVYNKNSEVISTSITNLDLHDIARTVATYGVEKYYLTHPLQTQHDIISEILQYWQTGYGGTYNLDRKLAFEKVVLKKSLDEVIEDISANYPGQIKTVVTDARKYTNSIEYAKLRAKIADDNDTTNYLILFGTGWGMTKPLMEKADYRLLPIYGAGEYNHLSVRSAVAIILDRLLGEKWY